MYAIYAYIGVVLGVNVGIYCIHGVFGYISMCFFVWSHFLCICCVMNICRPVPGKDDQCDDAYILVFDSVHLPVGATQTGFLGVDPTIFGGGQP